MIPLGRCGDVVDIWFTKISMPTANEIIYEIGLFLFSLIYRLIDTVYQLFMALGNAQLFKQESIEALASRVYIVLGIVMLFFVTYQLFTMLFDPKKLTSKGDDSGMGILKNVVITVVLLASCNLIFSTAMDIQNAILRDDVIGRIFFGVSGTTVENAPDSNDMYHKGGRTVATTILSVFWHPKNGDSSTAYNNAEFAFYTGDGITNKATKTYTYRQVIANLSGDDEDWDINKLYDIDCKHLNSKQIGGQEDLTYDWFTAILIGIFCVYVLVIYCIDLGYRVVKLGFYQIIAPIPISMRIIPKKKKVFSDWVSSTLSCFAEIFIRIAIMYFAVYTIKVIGETLGNLTQMWSHVDGEKPTIVIQLFAVAFIIWGIFKFMLEAPKLFSSLFGFKGGGDYGLSLSSAKKRFTSNKYGRGAIGGIAGAALSAVSNFRNAKRPNGTNTFGRRMRSAAGGLTSGFYNGARNASDPNARIFRSIGNTRRQVAEKRREREERAKYRYDNDIGLNQRFRDYADGIFGDHGELKATVTHRIEAGNAVAELEGKIKSLFTSDAAYQEANTRAATLKAQVENMRPAYDEARDELSDSSASSVKFGRLTEAHGRYIESQGRIDASKQNVENKQAEINESNQKLARLNNAKAEFDTTRDKILAGYDSRIASASESEKTILEVEKTKKTQELNDREITIKTKIENTNAELAIKNAEKASLEAVRDSVIATETTVQADIISDLGIDGVDDGATLVSTYTAETEKRNENKRIKVEFEALDGKRQEAEETRDGIVNQIKDDNSGLINDTITEIKTKSVLAFGADGGAAANAEFESKFGAGRDIGTLNITDLDGIIGGKLNDFVESINKQAADDKKVVDRKISVAEGPKKGEKGGK